MYLLNMGASLGSLGASQVLPQERLSPPPSPFPPRARASSGGGSIPGGLGSSLGGLGASLEGGGAGTPAPRELKSKNMFLMTPGNGAAFRRAPGEALETRGEKDKSREDQRQDEPTS